MEELYLLQSEPTTYPVVNLAGWYEIISRGGIERTGVKMRLDLNQSIPAAPRSPTAANAFGGFG